VFSFKKINIGNIPTLLLSFVL